MDLNQKWAEKLNALNVDMCGELNKEGISVVQVAKDILKRNEKDIIFITL